MNKLVNYTTGVFTPHNNINRSNISTANSSVSNSANPLLYTTMTTSPSAKLHQPPPPPLLPHGSHQSHTHVLLHHDAIKQYITTAIQLISEAIEITLLLYHHRSHEMVIQQQLHHHHPHSTTIIKNEYADELIDLLLSRARYYSKVRIYYICFVIFALSFYYYNYRLVIINKAKMIFYIF